jgi:hypothetical protein
VDLEGLQLFIPMGVELVEPRPQSVDGVASKAEQSDAGVSGRPLVNDDAGIQEYPKMFAHHCSW